MSLVRLAVRLATVAALQGRTNARDAVKDSAIPEIDDLTVNERRPYIVVYCDDGTVSPMSATDLFSTDGAFSLTIEIGVTAKMRFKVDADPNSADPAPEEVEEFAQPPTDDVMELALDVIGRQILIALADPQSPWAEFWRGIVKKIHKIRTVRGASAKEGLRFAGRQIEFEIEPYAEPPFGAAPTELWSKFLTLLEAKQDYAHLAPVVRGLIVGEQPLPDWNVRQQQAGATKADMEAMHLNEGALDHVSIGDVVTTVAPAP